MLLEEQTSRNALLEKRARKFDNELNLVNEERKAELSSKDKLQKEVDQLKSIKNQLEDQIQVSPIFISIPTLFYTKNVNTDIPTILRHLFTFDNRPIGQIQKS